MPRRAAEERNAEATAAFKRMVNSRSSTRIAQVGRIKGKESKRVNSYPQTRDRKVGEKGEKDLKAIDRVDIVFIIAVEGRSPRA